MALNCTGRIQISTNVTEVVTLGLASGTFPVDDSYLVNFAAGTGANAIDEEFTRSATLAISTPVTLTLSALTDDLGRAVPFARVKVFLADNTATTADGYDLRVAAGATSGWTAPFDGTAGKFTAKAGGLAFLYAPLATAFPVGAGTSDQVTITNLGAGSVTFNIVISGVNT